jgi:exodeoxyribonuclease VII large subunit
VGHEIDVTLSDLAADVRALTPSEAAERVAPSRDEIVDVLSGIRQRIDTLMMHRISQAEMRLRSVISRPVFASPERSLETPMQRLDDLHEALDNAMDASIQTRAERLERLSSVLDAISPLKTLARGYSVTMDATTGAVISSVKQLRLGQEIQTILNDGKFVSTIKSKT